jgi:hypothetical protein
VLSLDNDNDSNIRSPRKSRPTIAKPTRPGDKVNRAKKNSGLNASASKSIKKPPTSGSKSGKSKISRSGGK